MSMRWMADALQTSVLVAAVLLAALFLGGCRGTSPPSDPVPLPRIEVSATSLDLVATAGGPDPDPVTVTITNVGGSTLSDLGANVVYQSGSDWLSVSLDGTTAPATLTVLATGTGLFAGSYSATVSIVSTVAENSPQEVSVSFAVAPGAPGRIALSQGEMMFSAIAGGDDPEPQTAAITNAGEGPLRDLVASVEYLDGSDWLAVDVDPTTAPTTLTVQPSASGLATGEYSATVRVQSSAADNSPQTVGVCFTVLPHDIVINEIRTGTTASASDEFVELYNPCEYDIDLLSWKLAYRSASGATDVTLFAWTSSMVVPAHGFLLLGGAAYVGPKDGSFRAGGMAAAGGGVALRDQDGIIVDSVGYGTATNAFVESAAAVAPPTSAPPGASIGRLPDGADSGNNQADFALTGGPTPREANAAP